MSKDTSHSSRLTPHVAVIGLGYVGLQLASAFGRVLPTIGYDINKQRIQELKRGYDRNGELSETELKAPYLEFADDPARLREANFIRLYREKDDQFFECVVPIQSLRLGSKGIVAAQVV